MVDANYKGKSDVRYRAAQRKKRDKEKHMRNQKKTVPYGQFGRDGFYPSTTGRKTKYYTGGGF